MNFPSEVGPRQPISAKEWNNMVRVVKSLRLRGGPGLQVAYSPQGTTAKVKVTPPTPTSTTAATGPFPFDVEFSAGSDVDHTTATVRPGTINGLVPTNILTTPDLAIATPYYLVLSATVSDGAVTSCSLSFDTSTPSGMPTAQGVPPLSFTYLLGMIIGGEWFRTIGNGSLFAQSYEVFRTSKTSPDPGTLPYDIWYSWALTNA